MRALLHLPPGGPRLALRRVAGALATVAVLVAAASCGTGLPTPTPATSLAAVLPATAPPVAPTDPATPSPSPSPATPTPFAPASPDPGASPGASASPTPTPSPTPPFHGRPLATRIVIAKLKIDLAVVKAPKGYPYCNVAMYFGKPFAQPGEAKATYIFAHARDGMFGPIYQLVMFRHTPNAMLGMEVDVYTSDDMLHVYRIARVLPHQLSLDRALAARKDQLWLQTSEGPHGTPGKTQIIANPVSVSAADHAAAHPKARIVVCG
jgi:hypothetical protein